MTENESQATGDPWTGWAADGVDPIDLSRWDQSRANSPAAQEPDPWSGHLAFSDPGEPVPLDVPDSENPFILEPQVNRRIPYGDRVWPFPEREIVVSCGECRTSNGKRSRKEIGRLYFDDPADGWMLTKDGCRVYSIECPNCHVSGVLLEADTEAQERLSRRFLQGTGATQHKTDLAYLKRAGLLNDFDAPPF